MNDLKLSGYYEGVVRAERTTQPAASGVLVPPPFSCAALQEPVPPFPFLCFPPVATLHGWGCCLCGLTLAVRLDRIQQATATCALALLVVAACITAVWLHMARAADQHLKKGAPELVELSTMKSTPLATHLLSKDARRRKLTLYVAVRVAEPPLWEYTCIA